VNRRRTRIDQCLEPSPREDRTMRAFLAGIMLLGFTAASASACGFIHPKGAAKHVAPAPVTGTEIDKVLAREQPAPDVLAKVQDLRAQIASLVAANKVDEALAAEKDAMGMLGYYKAYLRCGPGIAVWMKQPVRATAPRPRSAPST
jgi:hypothetical protein